MENLKKGIAKYVVGGMCFTTFILFFCACEKMGFEAIGFVYSDPNVNERFEDSMIENTAQPNADILISADEYRFLVGSDMHIGSTQNTQKFLAIGNADSLSRFFIFTGDLCRGTREDYDTAVKYLKSDENKRCLFVAGNHDLYFEGWGRYIHYFGSSTYSLKVQTPLYTDFFIFLESGSSTLGQRQMDWLKEQLKTRSAYRYCLVFTHANFMAPTFNTSSPFNLEEVMALYRLFAKYKVNYVVSGHEHNKNITPLQGVNYIIVPALRDGNSKAGYLEVNIGNTVNETLFKAL